jgi:DNA-binding response OmpR family regulator
VAQDSEGPYAWGDCELNPASRQVFRGGKLVELTAKEYALLAFFISRRGCALTRDAILDAVWALRSS